MTKAECGVRPENIRRFVETYDGGSEIAVQILMILREEVPSRIERLREAYEEGSLAAAAEVIHSLVSSIGVLGNTCQTEALRDLEKELRNFDRAAPAGQASTAPETGSAVEESDSSQDDPGARLSSKVAHAESEMKELLSAIEELLSTMHSPGC